MISIRRVVFSRTSMRNCFMRATSLEKLKYYDPVITFETC
jgi:hypothetical protein